MMCHKTETQNRETKTKTEINYNAKNMITYYINIIYTHSQQINTVDKIDKMDNNPMEDP